LFDELLPALAGGQKMQKTNGLSRIIFTKNPFGFSLICAKASRKIDFYYLAQAFCLYINLHH
jgi:hypothetical protein